MKPGTMFSTAIILAAVIAGLVYFLAKWSAPWQWVLVWLGLLAISQVQVLVLRRKANKRAKILQELRDIHDIIEEPDAKKPKPQKGDYPLITFESETIAALLELGRNSKYTAEGRAVFLSTARKMVRGNASLDSEIRQLAEGKK